MRGDGAARWLELRDRIDAVLAANDRWLIQSTGQSTTSAPASVTVTPTTDFVAECPHGGDRMT